MQIICGCFRGSLDEFAAEVAKTHGDNNHGQEYGHQITLMRMLVGGEKESV